MDILHYLNVGIGFALSMLVLATLIGTTSEMWLGAIRTRTRHLENSLQQVLTALGVEGKEADLLGLAKDLTRHGMMSGWSPLKWRGLGSADAMGREEFVLTMLRLAAKGDGKWAGVKKRIGELVPGKTAAELLPAVEKAILSEEAANPSAPSSVSRTKALAAEAPGLTAPLFAQFDELMMRAEDNTMFSGRLVSGLLAAVFLVIYPVNSFDILARLTNDRAVAAALVAEAEKKQDSAELVKAVKAQGIFGDAFSTDGRVQKQVRKDCATNPGLPCTVDKSLYYAIREPGVWTTFFLVSLGAPFWQALLTRLIGLKSKIGTKTEGDRQFRATQT